MAQDRQLLIMIMIGSMVLELRTFPFGVYTCKSLEDPPPSSSHGDLEGSIPPDEEE